MKQRPRKNKSGKCSYISRPQAPLSKEIKITDFDRKRDRLTSSCEPVGIPNLSISLQKKQNFVKSYHTKQILNFKLENEAPRKKAYVKLLKFSPENFIKHTNFFQNMNMRFRNFENYNFSSNNNNSNFCSINPKKEENFFPLIVKTSPNLEAKPKRNRVLIKGENNLKDLFKKNIESIKLDNFRNRIKKKLNKFDPNKEINKENDTERKIVKTVENVEDESFLEELTDILNHVEDRRQSTDTKYLLELKMKNSSRPQTSYGNLLSRRFNHKKKENN